MPGNDPNVFWTGIDEDNFYMRWREWMLVATTRGAIIVANTKHQGIFKDLMERLDEDPWWKLQHNSDRPIMMFKEVVPFDVMLFWTKDKGLQTPAELVGKTGFGRLNAMAPSNNGVMPWTAAKPDKDAKKIVPD